MIDMDVVAIDTERVLCEGNVEAVAQVVMVDEHLTVIFNAYILPNKPVVDYRTEITGITAELLMWKGEPKEDVLFNLKKEIADKIVVGHSIFNDLDALGLHINDVLIRDTQTYPYFRKLVGRPIMSLTHLCEVVLQLDLRGSRLENGGKHDAAEDASVVMQLYQDQKIRWENLARHHKYQYNIVTARQEVEKYKRLSKSFSKSFSKSLEV
eukprot:Platyproteum_vivax@DN2888_c0_g1_i1.p1